MAMDLNMATDSYVQLVVTAFSFDIHLLIFFFLPSVLRFSFQSCTVFYSKSGISEKKAKVLLM